MARIRVVEPVMVVGDVVGTTLTLHAKHIGLASVPEAIVGNGHQFRVRLDVAGAITLGMVAATIRAIEEVHVVNPDIGVVSIK